MTSENKAEKQIVQDPQIQTTSLKSIYAISGNVINKKEEINLSSLRPDHPSYYRSQILESYCGINPLINAAAALLTIHRNLQNNTEIEQVGNFYQLLMHEVLAFETSARQAQYSSDNIIIARFFLLMMLEEIITEHPQFNNKWQKWQLLYSFQIIDSPEEQFYSLIEKLARDPVIYNDLLELVFIILTQGYQGIFRNSENTSLKTAKISDDLYHIIKAQRPNLTSLFSDKKEKITINQDIIKKNNFAKKLVYIFAFGFSLISIVYLGTTHYAVEPLQKNLAKLEKHIEFKTSIR